MYETEFSVLSPFLTKNEKALKIIPIANPARMILVDVTRLFANEIIPIKSTDASNAPISTKMNFR